MKRFVRGMKKATHLLNEMKVTPTECLHQQLFLRKPYGRADGKPFVEACRKGEIQVVRELLAFDRYLVFDYDYIE